MRDHLSPIFYSGTDVILRSPRTELNVSVARAPPICPHSLSYARRFPRPNGKHENFGARDQAAVTASDTADISE